MEENEVYRAHGTPGRNGREYTVKSVQSVSVDDPELQPHENRIFVATDDDVRLEFYVGRDRVFNLFAMYRGKKETDEVQPDEAWARETVLRTGSEVTLLSDLPLPRTTWPIGHIEVSIGH